MRLVQKFQTSGILRRDDVPIVDYVHSDFYQNPQKEQYLDSDAIQSMSYPNFSWSIEKEQEENNKKAHDWINSYFRSPGYKKRVISQNQVSDQKGIPIVDPRYMRLSGFSYSEYTPPSKKHPEGMLATSLYPSDRMYSYQYNNVDDTIKEAPYLVTGHETTHNWDQTNGDLTASNHYPKEFQELLNKAHEAEVTPIMEYDKRLKDFAYLRNNKPKPVDYLGNFTIHQDHGIDKREILYTDPHKFSGSQQQLKREYQKQANDHDQPYEDFADSGEARLALAMENIIDSRYLDAQGKIPQITPSMIQRLRNTKSGSDLRFLQRFSDEDAANLLNSKYYKIGGRLTNKKK